MATARKRRFTPVPEMTAEESWNLFDQIARRIGMSGEEFIRRYDAYEIDVDDPAIHGDAIVLEMMLPNARRNMPSR